MHAMLYEDSPHALDFMGLRFLRLLTTMFSGLTKRSVLTLL
jgi:hypothetical protein